MFSEAAGLITLDTFFIILGVVFIITTTCIAFFLKEKKHVSVSTDEENLEIGILEAYKVLWKLLCHPLMHVMIVFLLFVNFPFTAAENIVNLQLIDQGVSSETIAQLNIPMIGVKILATFIVTKFAVGPKPMHFFLLAYPFRLIMCLVLGGLVSNY